MKVIGTAAGGRLLIEATRNEVARLRGYDDEYSLKDKNRGYGTEPGDQIDIDGLYKHVVHMKAIEKRLLEAKAQIDRASEGLLLAHDKIHTAMTPEPPTSTDKEIH
jgi:hypothetical protein